MAQIIDFLIKLPSLLSTIQSILTIIGSAIFLFVAQRMFKKYMLDQAKIANEQKKIDQQKKIEDETKNVGDDYNKAQDDIRNTFND